MGNEGDYTRHEFCEAVGFQLISTIIMAAQNYCNTWLLRFYLHKAAKRKFTAMVLAVVKRRYSFEMG